MALIFPTLKQEFINQVKALFQSKFRASTPEHHGSGVNQLATTNSRLKLSLKSSAESEEATLNTSHSRRYLVSLFSQL
ncbi:unnamed protein product [Hymenolepis diminuta]|uniref:Uncharacterized protein n=1 Tax=Hymenolepis diminuta TaxID=6216 RepID=A0A564ZDG4_HYMDI|nr:unnamed protein product [Hymenolepis diminuta]VUZ57409.1 unnamed protein product [Hymenolepis diminuta]VUZ57410.1 unnamed protein product [Hymenolepis diminuta]